MSTSDDLQLLAAIERVRRDLAATLGPDAVLIEISTGSGPEVSIATSELHPSMSGLYLQPGESMAQLVTRLADTVQDLVVESSRLWGQPWPACPEHLHGHPLSASFTSPGMWTCPSSGEVIAPIGQLNRP